MIFVDTWAWLALAYSRDPYHAIALRQHRQLQADRQVYITTDYVLSEVISVLFGVVDFDQARRFVDGVLRPAASSRRQMHFVSRAQFDLAWALRQQYDDKPDISFIDFTSMAVMKEMGITDVFTGDQHFHIVNMGFRLLPGPTT